jgi:hypothetical protein
MDNRLQWRARAIVLAATLAFGLQLGYMVIAEEPYPAIMMPRFSWAGPSGSPTIDIRVPEITFRFADGTTKAVTQQQLLAHVPDGHHSYIMDNMLSPLPDAPPTRRAPGNKLEPPLGIFRGYNLGRVSRLQPDHVRSLRAWLVARAHEAYAGSPPVHCSVTWHVDSFRYDARAHATERTARHHSAGRFDLDLE